MKTTIYWVTRDRESIRKIRHKFGIPFYTSVNGETETDIPDGLMPLLMECERRGYIQIRHKTKTNNNQT